MQAWLTTQLARVDKWQLPTGGFGWWFLMGLPITQPWLTIHTTHVLVRAKARGISLPHGVLDKALACCKDIERHIGPISETCRIAILAKALWIRSLAAAESAALLRSEVVALLGRMGGVTGKHSNLESVAFLLMAAKLCDESTTPAPLLQHLANSAHETAETATFATSCEKPELPNPSYRSRATDPELPIRSYRSGATVPLPTPYQVRTTTKPLPNRYQPAALQPQIWPHLASHRAPTQNRQLAHHSAQDLTAVTDGDSHTSKLFMIHSDARTDALVLMALVLASPASPLVVKCLKGLFGHRRKGRWNNTQENVWALLAVDTYFQASRTRHTPTPSDDI